MVNSVLFSFVVVGELFGQTKVGVRCLGGVARNQRLDFTNVHNETFPSAPKSIEKILFFS